jgi:hypothetical protein
MLTAAKPEIRELQSAIMAGADDFVMMPFNSRQIDETLARDGFHCQPAGCTDM